MKIAIFTDRTTLRSSAGLSSLFAFKKAANDMGHGLDFVFKDNLLDIHKYQAVLIRGLTDPLNSTYMVARLCEQNGIRVLDKSEDIRTCADKISMYSHLKLLNVPMPATKFIAVEDLTELNGKDLFEEMGTPLVLKAPHSSFSAYVAKAHNIDEFIKIGKKFTRRADWIVVQQYLPSRFDWRVILLDGKVLSVCQYIMDPNAWKIVDKDKEGNILQCTVEGKNINDVSPELIETAKLAGKAIGTGIYGVDLKEVDGKFYVIEVNDNPNIDEGLEDQQSPKIYEWIISYLVGVPFEGLVREQCLTA